MPTNAHIEPTQCKVLYVGNYLNPSFGPFVEVCCSTIGFFKFLMQSEYDIFELSSIFTHLHSFFTPPLFACSSL